MTPADQAAVAAAIAASVTALLTLVIAGANYRAARTDATAADFNSCLDVVTKLAEAQRKVFLAPNQSAKEFEFRELLNLMEALALLENSHQIAPSTRKFVGHFLEEAWAFLRSEKSLHPLLEGSITGTETFAELTKFAKKRSTSIDQLTAHYRRQKAAIDAGEAA